MEKLYPLGQNVFAYVKTRKRGVKIHIREYGQPTNVKGGRVRPTRKGIALGLNQFQRLFHVQKRLAQDFDSQMSKLFVSGESLSNAAPKKRNMSSCLIQQVSSETKTPGRKCIMSYVTQERNPDPPESCPTAGSDEETNC